MEAQGNIARCAECINHECTFVGSPNEPIVCPRYIKQER